MPIARRAPQTGVTNHQFENINNLIKISEIIEEEKVREVEADKQDDPVPDIDEGDFWLVKYDELAQKTKAIPLTHLGCCKEGGELFSTLCMWIDINQKYVDLGMFPQWYDIARELNIDNMKTEWVKTCVRPEQSFTRAILEIYMNDGGTLGDVIMALRKQKQYRIIQEISDKADEFLDLYTVYHKTSFNPAVAQDNHLYSIIRTLYETFNKVGQEDPLSKYQEYSKGFINYYQSKNNNLKFGTDIVVNAVQTDDGVQQQSPSVTQDSGYTSPREYGGYLQSMPSMEVLDSISFYRKEKNIVNDNMNSDTITVRILLVFARDGVEDAENIVNINNTFVFNDNNNIKVDIFRLNEFDLWNAVLQNPEACILKWLDEIDFVMPILTPQLLRDLHENEVDGPPAPTSPLLNKYIYSLLRTQYVSCGCKNLKVRPLIPQQFEPLVAKSKPVSSEPLFRMWNYTDRETVEKRLNAMVKLWAKNNGHL